MRARQGAATMTAGREASDSIDNNSHYHKSLPSASMPAPAYLCKPLFQRGARRFIHRLFMKANIQRRDKHTGRTVSGA